MKKIYVSPATAIVTALPCHHLLVHSYGWADSREERDNRFEDDDDENFGKAEFWDE